MSSTDYKRTVDERFEKAKTITSFKELKERLPIHGNAYGDMPIFRVADDLLLSDDVPMADKCAICDYVANDVMGLDYDPANEAYVNAYVKALRERSDIS